MKIGNFTPHSISLIDPASAKFDPAIRKFTSASPVVLQTIPSSGMLSCKYDEVTDLTGPVPQKVKVLASIDPIPADVDLAIVSGLYASASSDPRVRTVIDPVFDETGTKILGCLFVGAVVNPQPALPDAVVEALAREWQDDVDQDIIAASQGMPCGGTVEGKARRIRAILGPHDPRPCRSPLAANNG